MLNKMKIWSTENYHKYVLSDEDGVDIKDLAKKIGKDIEKKSGLIGDEEQ